MTERPIRVCIRADAAIAIGTGHVVRCATLARLLMAKGSEVVFVCRKGDGDLIGWLVGEGFRVKEIGGPSGNSIDEIADSEATIGVLEGRHYEWLIVDHYGLGVAWERAIAGIADQILVIDDLGRTHECDLLLDQNYGSPAHALYPVRTPSRCRLLLGAEFALLRPEFAELRAASLARRRNSLSRILVFMGGSDPSNETCKALRGIAGSGCVPAAIDVVIGSSNPHGKDVERACAAFPQARLHVQTDRMAQLMSEADCAIGAGGTASWERCALGLPALVAVLADNQTMSAVALHAAGAHRFLGRGDELTDDDYARALGTLDALVLAVMSKTAATLCDGTGRAKVAARLHEPVAR